MILRFTLLSVNILRCYFLGIYTCIASTNNAGSDTKSGRLTVLANQSVTSSTIGPKIDATTPSHTTLEDFSTSTLSVSVKKDSLPKVSTKRLEGTNVVIPCKSEGYITSIKAWYKVMKLSYKTKYLESLTIKCTDKFLRT